LTTYPLSAVSLTCFVFFARTWTGRDPPLPPEFKTPEFKLPFQPEPRRCLSLQDAFCPREIASLPTNVGAAPSSKGEGSLLPSAYASRVLGRRGAPVPKRLLTVVAVRAALPKTYAPGQPHSFPLSSQGSLKLRHLTT